MGGCMSFRRNGAENTYERSEKWKVESGKSKLESENWKVEVKMKMKMSIFFFFLASSSVYLPRYDKYGPNLGEADQAVQVR